MKRSAGYGLLAAAAALAFLSGLLRQYGNLPLVDVTVEVWTVKFVSAMAVLAVVYGLYLLVVDLLVERTANKRRRHNARNVVRLVFGVAAAVGLLAVTTESGSGCCSRWVSSASPSHSRYNSRCSRSSGGSTS